jgi:gliding motility-associated protein GldM
MSIPKEPRQLMINVMYLVLTALLALNVSAEIFNAFAMVNKGLKTANSALDKSNETLPQSIKDSAKKKGSLQIYADRVDPVRQVSKDHSAYIQKIMDMLIDKGGNNNGKVESALYPEGDYIDNYGLIEPQGKKNYDITTKTMVDAGEGEKLKKAMLDVREKFLSYVDPAERATFNLPIEIDDKTWKGSANKKANWSDFTFGHMPLGATEPIFSKFINDTKASEAAVLNYLAGKVGLTSEVVLDKFRVVSAPKKSYLLNGETYEADVFLSAAAGNDSKTGISISVNGTRLPLDKDGNARYVAKATSLGKKTYTANASVTNPVTGKTDSYKQEFEYEVGEKSATISASKMNVFYVGVDNPVEVSAAGVSSNQIKVDMSNGSISRNGDGTYTVKVTSPGAVAKVSLTAPGLTYSKDFRVKRIPDPVVKLGRLIPGRVGDGEFKAQGGLIPWLEGFDFDAKCQITEYNLIRQPKRQDPEFNINRGGSYEGKSQSIIAKATIGDNFIYQDIKCKCPGDATNRPLGSIVYTIK